MIWETDLWHFIAFECLEKGELIFSFNFEFF